MSNDKSDTWVQQMALGFMPNRYAYRKPTSEKPACVKGEVYDANDRESKTFLISVTADTLDHMNRLRQMITALPSMYQALQPFVAASRDMLKDADHDDMECVIHVTAADLRLAQAAVGNAGGPLPSSGGLITPCRMSSEVLCVLLSQAAETIRLALNGELGDGDRPGAMELARFLGQLAHFGTLSTDGTQYLAVAAYGALLAFKEVIAGFERHCAEKNHTDTGVAWEIFDRIRDHCNVLIASGLEGDPLATSQAHKEFQRREEVLEQIIERANISLVVIQRSDGNSDQVNAVIDIMHELANEVKRLAEIGIEGPEEEEGES